MFESKNVNFTEFNAFLNKIPESEFKYEDIYVLKTFAFWINKFVDVEIKINIFRDNFSFKFKIPHYEKWITFYKADSKEKLLEYIFSNGLGKIKEVFKEYNVLYKIHNKDYLTVNELEKKFSTSIFWLEHHSKKIIEIWQYNKTKSEVRSRIGKDNLIWEEKNIKYHILIGGNLILDSFIEKLIPKEKTIEETDYGFIASSPLTERETVYKDVRLTSELIEKYNDILHYKYLIENNLREIKDDDNIIYKEIINTTANNGYK
ncbi:hypothetical protein BWZ20_00140 [Winogradskyella sp. J14-2]|uniref:hypothetical protein n=1 Tax=Winogradskyella sp. J14-2 TaxID=1936080 RepID=UPI000972A658|nr:hypothetical protein [Winogradskyella sp. J14-2]APY06801.1 hypothetical protein BWZ20_00140 [Winogradskyella sp. J14-2]